MIDYKNESKKIETQLEKNYKLPSSHESLLS